MPSMSHFRSGFTISGTSGSTFPSTSTAPQTKKPELAVPRPMRLGSFEVREGDTGCCEQVWTPQTLAAGLESPSVGRGQKWARVYAGI